MGTSKEETDNECDQAGKVDGQRHRTGSRQSGARHRMAVHAATRGAKWGHDDAREATHARLVGEVREALATTVMSALARGVRIEAMEAHASDPALQEGTFRNDTPRAGFKGLVHAITATFAVRAATRTTREMEEEAADRGGIRQGAAPGAGTTR